MNQNFQGIVQDAAEANSPIDQTFLLGGAVFFFNLFVMLFVGVYWMNPVMHEFISGRPLL